MHLPRRVRRPAATTVPTPDPHRDLRTHHRSNQRRHRVSDRHTHLRRSLGSDQPTGVSTRITVPQTHLVDHIDGTPVAAHLHANSRSAQPCP
ncbi:hypothetical protein Pd630_LPD03779 [Rhodococcus opacus PD630]|nr:hypothetical protein Pd630_LPD03779 [Rhodococcus opacus PD630]